MEKEKLFSLLVELLEKLDQVCQEHNFQYWVIAGTLLGAVRHKGIIPWDDDIDVCMPRNDYDKLIQLGDKLFDGPFYLQTSANDPGFHKGFARLRNSNSTEIPYKDAAYKCNHGVFLDIFPLDDIPSSEKEFKRRIKVMKVWEGVLHFQGRFYSDLGSYGLNSKKRIAYDICKILFQLKIITPHRIYKIYHKIAAGKGNQIANKVGLLTVVHDSPRYIFMKEMFSKTIRLPFENITVNAPAEYDSILTTSYGDYMTPVQQPTEHGSIVFDADIPFAEYVKSNREELWDLWVKYRHQS